MSRLASPLHLVRPVWADRISLGFLRFSNGAPRHGRGEDLFISQPARDRFVARSIGGQAQPFGNVGAQGRIDFCLCHGRTMPHANGVRRLVCAQDSQR